MMQNVLSVTQLNGYIKAIFNAEEMLHDICVCGEVSGLSQRASNVFFDLKDENGKINCAAFGAKTYIPQNGEAVIAFGSVSYWDKMGKLSFNVRSIKPLGEGALAIRLEQLKNRLREEGYFDEGHKKPVPQFPKRVCVVTSAAGAVKRDIITTVRAVNNYTDIDILDTPVQGVEAAGKLCAAIAAADKAEYDVIVIARGGGSMEELMPFNDEKLVKTIYAAKTPIISAVGHETDFTLCDMVADKRVPTPTAAGNLLAFDVGQLIAYIEDMIDRGRRALFDKISERRMRLQEVCMRMSSVSKERIASARGEIFALGAKMSYSARALCDGSRGRLENAVIKLKMLDPRSMLSKGYFILHKGEKQVRGVAELSAGDIINIRGADGQAAAEISEVKNDV